MDEAQRLLVLQNEWTGCTRCTLHKMRESTEIVFGRGTAPADYLFVGTWPSGDDEEYHTPFLDLQGELIHEMMRTVGIDHENVFFTYILGCRPKLLIPATDETEERIEDRQPDKEEVLACRPRLTEIIYQVDPRIIVTFGLLPLQALVVGGTRIRKIAGQTKQLYEAHIPGRIEDVRYPVIASIGTDMLVKNPSSAKHGPFGTTLETLSRAREYVTWIKKKEGVE